MRSTPPRRSVASPTRPLPVGGLFVGLVVSSFAVSAVGCKRPEPLAEQTETTERSPTAAPLPASAEGDDSEHAPKPAPGRAKEDGEETASPPDHSDHHDGEEAEANGDDHQGQGMRHSFADVARFRRLFDAPDRDEWQKPAEVVRLLAIEPGMIVVDLGAGTGYFLEHLVDAVGDEGTVLALDVEPNMVAHMEDRADARGYDQVKTRVVEEDDPGLDRGSVDRVLIVDTWHHLGDRPAYAGQLREALRPGGFVLVVDFTRDSERGPPKRHKLPAGKVVEELEAGGFAEVAVMEETLPDQYVIRARVGR